MKKLTMAVIFILSSFVLSQGVLDQYDIPEYQSQSFSLSGDDLFNMTSTGDASSTSMNFGADYNSYSQRPGYNLGYGVQFDYTSSSDDSGVEGSSAVDNANWWMDVPFEMYQYFGGTRGMFGFAEGNMFMFGGDESEGNDDTSDLYLTIGAGYGRVVSAKPIAQAFVIADALGVDASDDTILAIAEVLGAEDSYEALYKNDAEQKFYDDVANAAGASNGAMTVYKVLRSGIYNVSDRWTGYAVKASLWNNYMRAEGDDHAGRFLLEAEYAMPMDSNAQLLAEFSYGMDLNDDTDLVQWGDRTMIDEDEYLDDDMLIENPNFGEEVPVTVFGGYTDMHLGVSYTLDHSYTWQSAAGFTYDSWGLKDNSPTEMRITASTTYAVLNQMTVTGSFSMVMPDNDNGNSDDDDATTEIKTTVTYWVF